MDAYRYVASRLESMESSLLNDWQKKSLKEYSDGLDVASCVVDLIASGKYVDFRAKLS